jgi:hypothetical protein
MKTIAIVSIAACTAFACSLQSSEKTNRTTQTVTGTCSGWTVVASPNIGSQDNVLGAISGPAPDDVWAVGQYVQDANPDFQQTLAQHFDGTAWSVVPTPDVGSQANTLYSVTTPGHLAWATGYFIGADNSPQSLIEKWDGQAWTVVDHPHVGESDWLYGVSAFSPSDIWAVGATRDDDGAFHTLIEHFDGRSWSIVSSPNPGSSGNQLYGVLARAQDDAWAVGSRVDGSDPDRGLIVHWDGARWSAVASPSSDSTVLLHGVSGPVLGSLHAVGTAASNVTGARAVALSGHGSDWAFQSAASVGLGDNALYSVTSAADPEWAAGTYLDPPSGNNFTLIERETAAGWVRVDSPNPSVGGSNILGGVARVGAHDVWAVGTFDGPNARQTLILHNCE